MTVAAVEGIPYMEGDDREVVRPGPTYTFDTVSGLADHDVTLILGADAASRIASWHRSTELQKMVGIAVAPRPGVHPETVEQAVIAPLRWFGHSRISTSPVRTCGGARLRRSERALPRPGECVALYRNYRPLPLKHPSALPGYNAGRPKEGGANPERPAIEQQQATGIELTSAELAVIAAHAIDAKQGTGVVIPGHGRPAGRIVDIFVIGSGTSKRQVRTMIEEVKLRLGRYGRKPLRTEGLDTGRVGAGGLRRPGDPHLPDRGPGDFYALERLWGRCAAPRLGARRAGLIGAVRLPSRNLVRWRAIPPSVRRGPTTGL